MAFSIPNGAFQLQRTEPDVTDAISKGITAGFKPRSQAEELLGNMLKNKINTAKAKYAEQQALADLQHTQAGTTNLSDEHGMRGLKEQLLRANIHKALNTMDPVQKALLIEKAKSNMKNVRVWRAKYSASRSNVKGKLIMHWKYCQSIKLGSGLLLQGLDG